MEDKVAEKVTTYSSGKQFIYDKVDNKKRWELLRLVITYNNI
jgi:hypothetical protein